MTRVVYFTACTLDGFIADEHDSLDWLFEVPHGEDDGSWDAFIGRIGPMVTGTTTYRVTTQDSALAVIGTSENAPLTITIRYTLVSEPLPAPPTTPSIPIIMLLHGVLALRVDTRLPLLFKNRGNADHSADVGRGIGEELFS